MTKFAITALLAAAANATYQNFDITVDTNTRTKYFRSQDWSTSPVDQNDTRVSISSNNSLLIKDYSYDGHAYAFTPLIRGGAIQFTVDVSNHGCGCVAGAYLVAIKAGCNGEEEQADMPDGTMPSCPSIDIMQANPYGFNVAAHPCANGNCDAVSLC